MLKMIKELLEQGLFALIIFAVLLACLVVFSGEWLANFVIQGVTYQVTNMLAQLSLPPEEVTITEKTINSLQNLDFGALLLGYAIIVFFIILLLLFLAHNLLPFVKSKKIEPIKISEVFEMLQVKTHREQIRWLQKTHLNIYITAMDLEVTKDTYISAKWHLFIKLLLNSESYLKERIAEHRVCLEKNEFNAYLAEMAAIYSNANENNFKIKEIEYTALQSKNEKLEQENSELIKFKNTQAGREANLQNTAFKAYHIGKISHEFVEKIKQTAQPNTIGKDEVKEKLFEFIKEREEIFELLAETKAKKDKDALTAGDLIPAGLPREIKKELGEYARKQGRPPIQNNKKSMKIAK